MTTDFQGQYFATDFSQGLRFNSLDGRPLVQDLTCSYSTCAIYNLREELDRSNPRRIVLDRTDGLAVGDQILVTNEFYGGGARRAFQVLTHIAAVEANAIEIKSDLPEHLLRFSSGIVAIKRSPVEFVPIKIIARQSREPGAAFLAELHCRDFEMQLHIGMLADSPRIDFRAVTTYHRHCQIFHLGFTIESNLPLSELYLKNRTMEALQNGRTVDVWLWKEGLRAGDQDGGWILAHNPDVALVEVVTRSKTGFAWKTVPVAGPPRAVINLEHYQAQRYRRQVGHFGDDPNVFGFSTFCDFSTPLFSEGATTDRRFSVFAGAELPSPPRLMLAPGGYRAVHVWTEHADKTTLETHRAAYYGHESVTEASAAVGGFVRYGHIVTKSIFFDNPHDFANGVFVNGNWVNPGPDLAMRTNAEFETMLDDLAARGHEICIHSGAPDDNGPAQARHALREVSMRYKSPTWIDHDIQRVPANLGYKGMLPGDDYNLVDAWRNNGIKYFWSWASEDFVPRASSGINMLHNGSGPYTPTPLYWRHPTVTEDFITWAANECSLDAFSHQAILDLIRDRGVSIHHHYYPYICDDRYEYYFIGRDESGRYAATSRFNSLLEFMAKQRDAGELLITTIGKILDYWLALERIRIDLRTPDRFIIENSGDNSINGFAFVVQAQKIESKDVVFRSRTLDRGDLLVWFDMPAKACFEFRAIPVVTTN